MVSSVPCLVRTAGDIHIQNRTQTASPLQCYYCSCHDLVKDRPLHLILPPDINQLPSVLFGDSRVETTLFVFLRKLEYYRYKL